jgi:16S rRNA (cytidine1402-2'-O)-methyltransferase
LLLLRGGDNFFNICKKPRPNVSEKYFHTLEKFKIINHKGEWVVIIKGQKNKIKALYVDDILSCDLKPKDKAKLLAKITNRTTKEWYQEFKNINSKKI